MCCCNNNPCLRYECCCPQTSTTTTYPAPVCADINACVDSEFENVRAGQASTLTAFSDAAVFALNQAFIQIPLGLPSGLPDLRGAVISLLRSLPGYSLSGTLTLTIINGVLQWHVPGATTTTTTSTTTTLP